MMRPVESAGVGCPVAETARPFGKRTAAALLLGLLLFWTFPDSAHGGAPRRGPLDPGARAAMVARLRARAKADKAQAVRFANARGIPVRGSTGHQTYELMKVRNGRPLYYITHNVDAAMSTGADQVRTAHSVDGGGLTVGVWDGGWIYHRHQEFGGRVTLADFDLSDTGDGLWGEYFENMILDGEPAVSRVDQTIDFDWGANGKPYNPGPKENYSISWTGHVLADYSETYTFYALTGDDEGVRLWVDGQKLFDDWDSPVAGEHSGTIDLLAGERYNVTMEYFENTGPAMVQLRWSSDPSTSKMIIPQGNLFSSWATDWHATHVAGTIAASGVDALAKGMAPAVDIDSYEWNEDYAEMTAAGASAPGQADTIYVSNHSYGYIAGWNMQWSDFVWGWVWAWTGPSSDPFQDSTDPWFGQYETETAAVDGVAYGLPYYLIFCSAGNERSDNPAEGDTIRYVDPPWYVYEAYDPTAHPAGDGVYKSGYDTLSPWSGAKNIMSVGAVTDAVLGGARDAWSGRMRSFSSWGPTDDGRIKPDIVANGHDVYSSDDISPDAYYTANGTSMSSPNAAGSAILLQEYYADRFPGGALRASTLKGLIIHTADDLGRPGPDYCYGWGLMNAKAAADVITDASIALDSAPIIEGTLDSVSKTSYTHAVAWDGVSSLRATLCWTDPAGTATTGDDDRTAKLVNDLDLTITTGVSPDVTVWEPFVLDYANPEAVATRGVNSRDNVEQVLVDPTGTPVPCTVTVDYTGSLTNGSQQFALIITSGGQGISIDVQAPASVAMYDKLELVVDLTDATITNPYDPDPARGGLDLSATFTAPDETTTWDVNGFYDGTDWLIRFAPDTVGAWTFTVTATDSRGTATWPGGSFTCTVPGSLGWLRIDGQRLRFTEDWPNNPFFGVGHNNGWRYVVEQPTLSDMAARGENLLSFWMASPWVELGWGATWDNRAPIENMEQGLGYYYQPACSYIDGVVDRAETEGVYLLPTIWTHAQLRDTDHTWGDGWWWNNVYQDVCSVTDFFVMDSGGETPQWRLQKNYYRYMIARWGYSRAIAGWVALCEIDGTEGFVDDTPQAVSWCAAVRDYFQTNDKYRVNASDEYPMVASNLDSPSWDGGFDLRATDTYTSQYNDEGIALTIANQTETMRGSGLPCFHAEFGGNVPGGASQPAHMHNGIWAGFSNGAAMTPLLWCDGYDFPMLEDAGSAPQDPPITVNTDMRDHLEHLSDFAAWITYLGDSALEPIPAASLSIDDGNCRGWGMWLPATATEYDRGFGWIQDTDGTMGGETLDILDVDPGDYLIIWYDVWTSGQDNISLSSVTVDGTEVLSATIPAPVPAQSDIAFQFWPTSEAPTCVLMGETSARSGSGGAIVEWTTESEVDNLGFHVLRRPAAGGRWKRITEQLTAGRLTAVGPKAYRYLDLVAPGRYEYRVETVSTDGERERHGSRESMTVEVRDGGTVASLVETAGLLAERAAGACRAWRGRISTERRLGELAQRSKGQAPAASSRRDDRTRVRRVAPSATAARPGTVPDERRAARAADARPSPGDVCVRTRGDGVFFVPAARLPCAPERARLTTGGMRIRPLDADPSGIWFFAADYRDAYTDTNATFVGPGRAPTPTRGGGPAPPGLFAREGCSVMGDTARAEEDALFVSAATDAPDPWFSRAILWSGGPEHTVEVSLAGLVQGATALRVAVFGYSSDDAIDPDHELVVSVNDRAAADLFWDGRGYKVIEIPLEQGAVHDGANTIGLLTPLTASIPDGHGVILDYVEIEYPRALSVAGGALLVEVEERCVVEVAGLAAPGLWVVEIEPAGGARKVAAAFLEAGADGYVARFRTTGGRYYVARPDQVRAPLDTRDAVIASVPAGTNYLAVGPEVFRAAAGPLLDARRVGGLSAAYVSLESAIDTHGHGRYGAGAIVNLVRGLAPRYVLLVGDNCYDYLGREGKLVDPMVPAVLTRTRHDCQANADALYGDLDGDGTPEVPVGRLPVRTTGDLARLVAKIVGRDGSTSSVTGVLVADDASKGQDFAAAQEVVAASFPEVDWTKLYAGVHGDGAFVREALTRTVNSGSDLVVYQGHSSSSRLGSLYPLLDLSEAAQWTGAPVVYLSSCWGAYVQRNTEAASSVAEVLLRSQGGATAVIGSTAASTQETQRALLADFLAAGLREGDRIGDALVAAQRKAARRASGITAEGDRQDVLDAVHCYTVLGDPAMAIVFGPWKELAGSPRGGSGTAPPVRPGGSPADGRRGK